MKSKRIFTGIIWVLTCECIGLLGSFFAIAALPNWYAALAKPTFTPPNWLFASVWIFLFLLMGIAVSLIWTNDVKKETRQAAVNVFIIQLLLNLLWPVIFFGLHQILAAGIEIIILGVSIIGSIVLFSKISTWAGWLLVPYILWVLFTGYLNYEVWQLSNVSGPQFTCTNSSTVCSPQLSK